MGMTDEDIKYAKKKLEEGNTSSSTQKFMIDESPAHGIPFKWRKHNIDHDLVIASTKDGMSSKKQED